MKLMGYKVFILSAMLMFSLIYANQVNSVNPYGPMIILSFDDTKNIETCAKYVLPVLEEYDFKAIGFFTTGYNRFTRFKSYLMELIEAGWEIGSHAHTHPKFTEISYNEREYELIESKNILESILGEGNVLSFAYPGHNGIYDKDITEQVWKYYDYVRPASNVERWKAEFGYYNPLGKIVGTSKNDNCVSRTRSAVSYAISNNCPVWLVFHRVEPTPTSTSTVKKSYGPQYEVSGIRYWLHSDRARLVIDLHVIKSSEEVPSYELDRDSETDIVITLPYEGKAYQLQPFDKIVNQIIVSVPDLGTTKIEISLNRPTSFKYYLLHNPERMVFDFYPIN